MLWLSTTRPGVRVNLGPKIKSRVATNISQGKILKKVCAGVRSSSNAPTTPPAIETLTRDIKTARPTFK